MDTEKENHATWSQACTVLSQEWFLSFDILYFLEASNKTQTTPQGQDFKLEFQGLIDDYRGLTKDYLSHYLKTFCVLF